MLQFMFNFVCVKTYWIDDPSWFLGQFALHPSCGALLTDKPGLFSSRNNYNILHNLHHISDHFLDNLGIFVLTNSSWTAQYM